MLTVYAPVRGTTRALNHTEDDTRGVSVVAYGSGAIDITAPARGELVAVSCHGFEIVDEKRRAVIVDVRQDENSEGTIEPLLAAGSEVTWDQPVLRYRAADGGAARFVCDVFCRESPELIVADESGANVTAGADLFTIGPFSCGA